MFELWRVKLYRNDLKGNKNYLELAGGFLHYSKCKKKIQGKSTLVRASGRFELALGSLSNNVFERRTSTGSGFFSFFDGGFAQIFSQIASITVKKLRNSNFISLRHVKRENTSLPVDVRRSKTSLLKLPNVKDATL